MKKLLLTLGASAFVSIGAFAQATQLFLVGDGGPGWDPSNPKVLNYNNSTKKYDSYTFTSNTDKFKISTVKGNWDSDFNPNCISPASSNNISSSQLGTEISFSGKNSADITLPEKSIYTLDISYNNGYKVLITKGEAIIIEVVYGVHSDWTESGWSTINMTQEGEKWVLKNQTIPAGNFGIKGMNKNDPNDQQEWWSAPEGEKDRIVSNTDFTISDSGKNNFKNPAGTFDITFDPIGKTIRFDGTPSYPEKLYILGQPSGWTIKNIAEEWALPGKDGIYEATFNIAKDKFQLRFANASTINSWDDPKAQYGAKVEDEATSISLDNNYTGDLVNGKGSWKVDNWEGGDVNFKVDLVNYKVAFTIPSTDPDPDPDDPEETDQSWTVKFTNPGNWNEVYVWAWNETTDGKEFLKESASEPDVEWPGKKLTQDNGVWSYTGPGIYGVPTQIIIGNGKTQSINLPYSADKIYSDILSEDGNYTLAIHGSIWDGSNWTPKALTFENGKWILKKQEIVKGDFGIRIADKDNLETEKGWIAAADKNETQITSGNQVQCKPSGDNFNIEEGTYDIEFDPYNLLLTFTTVEKEEGGGDEPGDDNKAPEALYLAGNFTGWDGAIGNDTYKFDSSESGIYTISYNIPAQVDNENPKFKFAANSDTWFGASYERQQDDDDCPVTLSENTPTTVEVSDMGACPNWELIGWNGGEVKITFNFNNYKATFEVIDKKVGDDTRHYTIYYDDQHTDYSGKGQGGKVFAYVKVQENEYLDQAWPGHEMFPVDSPSAIALSAVDNTEANTPILYSISVPQGAVVVFNAGDEANSDDASKNRTPEVTINADGATYQAKPNSDGHDPVTRTDVSDDDTSDITFYVVSSSINGTQLWNASETNKMTYIGNGQYSWSGTELGNQFKIFDGKWSNDGWKNPNEYGSNGTLISLSDAYSYTVNGGNITFADKMTVTNPKVVLDVTAKTITVTGTQGGTDSNLNEYEGWFVNIIWQGNWEYPGEKVGNDGVGTLPAVPVGNNGFQVKIWNGPEEEDIFYSYTGEIPTGSWVTMSESEAVLNYIAGASDNSAYDISFDVVKGQIYITPNGTFDPTPDPTPGDGEAAPVLYLTGSTTDPEWSPTSPVELQNNNGVYTYTFTPNTQPSFKISTVKGEWEEYFDTGLLGAPVKVGTEVLMEPDYGDMKAPAVADYVLTITYKNGGYYMLLATTTGEIPEVVMPKNLYIKGDINDWKASTQILELSSSTPNDNNEYVYSGTLTSLYGEFKVTQDQGGWNGINLGGKEEGATLGLGAENGVDLYDNGNNISTDGTFTNVTLTLYYKEDGSGWLEAVTSDDPVVPTPTGDLYIIGNLGAEAGWIEGDNSAPGTGIKMSDNGDNTYSITNVSLYPSYGIEGKKAYFSFTTAVADTWTELNDIATRYGAADETQQTAQLNETNSMTIKSDVAWSVEPAIYNILVNLNTNTFVITFVKDLTDGIDSIENEMDGEVIYNLQGVRVDRNHLTKGIYIINGKKVMIK